MNLSKIFQKGDAYSLSCHCHNGALLHWKTRQLKHLQGCWVDNGLPVIATTNLIHVEILKQLWRSSPLLLPCYSPVQICSEMLTRNPLWASNIVGAKVTLVSSTELMLPLRTLLSTLENRIYFAYYKMLFVTWKWYIQKDIGIYMKRIPHFAGISRKFSWKGWGIIRFLSDE